MGNIAARAVVLLSLALAYSAGWQGGAPPTTKAGCAHHDNALRPGLIANLGPWIAASVSTNASTAEFALQHARQHVFPFIVHAGVVRVLVPFGRTDQGRPFWMKPLLELAELAAADPSLSFEFLFSVDDQPTQPLPAPGESFRYALPVWGYNQQEGYADFAAPHANTPDEMCAAAVEKDRSGGGVVVVTPRCCARPLYLVLPSLQSVPRVPAHSLFARRVFARWYRRRVGCGANQFRGIL